MCVTECSLRADACFEEKVIECLSVAAGPLTVEKNVCCFVVCLFKHALLRVAIVMAG